MGPSKQLGRRKACDLCCRKKIKCDAKAPKCSNCIVHDAPCLWTPGVAAPKGVVKRPAPDPPNVNIQWMSTVEQRLAAMEALLSDRMLSWPLVSPPQWQDVPTPDIFGTLPSPSNTAAPNAGAAVSNSPGAGANEARTGRSLQADHSAQNDGVNDDSPQLEQQSTNSQLTLPPSHVIYPIIKSYFSDGNLSLPIFDEPSMDTMILRWHQLPEERDQATWAVINVAMALGLQTASSPPGEGREKNDRMVQTCIANAQSVLDSLVTRDEDFKGLQTLLGLSVLFMYSPGPKPACVLVAMAVKLVHRLRAHTREGRERLNDETTPLQRDRLFWATFILDRDLSVKTMEPYVQQDNEYDVEPPSIDIPDDGVGVITSQDGTEKLNLFHYRVQLALIQGSIHDLVHSVRARGMPSEKRKAASARLGLQLWQWRCSIPEAFHYDKLVSWARNSTKGVPRGLLSMHLTFFLCFFMAHRLHIRDAEWVKNLTEFSDQFTRERQQRDTVSNRQDIGARSPGKREDIIPDHWYNFIEAARTVVGLVDLIDPADSALLWCSVCAHQAALTVLTANKLTVSLHHLYRDIDSDTQMIKKGLETLSVRLYECNFQISKHASLVELSERADLAVQAYSVKLRRRFQ